MSGERPDYIRHLIRQAFETLEEATVLLNNGFTTGVVNRLYYACFYAVSAVLASEGHSSSKHSGVMSLFDQYWVKPGRVPHEMGDFYHLLFKQRQKGDYECAEFTPDDLPIWLAEARSFVERLAEWLRTNAGIEA
ncbi:MAG: HEPN domain-containing protein [Armatimonadota bacterium]|nr:HEPN domain-containing protein [Armatimonadota bacterium]